MRIYKYDSQSKEYIGMTNTVKNKMTKQYNDVPNSTRIKPPKAVKNKIAVFDRENIRWKQVVDYRTQWLTDKTTGLKVRCDTIGKIDSNLTTIPVPTTVPSQFYKFSKTTKEWVYDESKLSEFKQYQIDKVKQEISDFIISYYDNHAQRTLLLLVSEGNIEAIKVWNWIKSNLAVIKNTVTKIRSRKTIQSILNITYTKHPFTKLKKLMDLI